MTYPRWPYYFLISLAVGDLSCTAVTARTGSSKAIQPSSVQVARTVGSDVRHEATVAGLEAKNGHVTSVCYVEEESIDQQLNPPESQSEPVKNLKGDASAGTDQEVPPPPPTPVDESSEKAETSSDARSQDRDEKLPPAPVLPDPVILESASLEETDRPFPINLATALRLADARPLVVAAAQASAWVAEAKLQRAQVLWVPQFNIGAVYYRHDGYGPDFNRGVNNPAYGGPTPGGPLSQNLNWFYGNASFYQTVNVADAYFQPLAARQSLDAQRFDIQTAKNDSLRETANAYFDVHLHRGQYTAALDVLARGEKLVQRIEKLSKDLVPRLEVNRTNRLLAAVMQRATSAREEWRISSANLTQILRLDPTAVVVPMEQDHLQVTLVDPARSLDELIAIGVAHRPEIASNKASVRAAEVRVRQEKNRPLLPLVLITGFQGPGGMMSQFGIFGTGSGSTINQWSWRDDVSLQLVWQLEGFGLGNLARIKERRGQQSEEIVRLFRNQDKVAAEVTAAQARVQASAVLAQQSNREVREAITNFEGNYEGLAQTTRFDNILRETFRPQEATRALERLMESYDRYFAAIAEYNKSQFELYHALGYPAREVSYLDSIGEIMDVYLERPFDLPVVYDGPPTATR